MGIILALLEMLRNTHLAALLPLLHDRCMVRDVAVWAHIHIGKHLRDDLVNPWRWLMVSFRCTRQTKTPSKMSGSSVVVVQSVRG